MHAILQGIKVYGEDIWKRKGRLALALVVFAGLYAASFHYLYDGLNKRFLIFSFLCLAISALIVCPRPKNLYLALPAVLVYLLVIPEKMFQRIEIPVHDMSELQGGAVLANVLIILLVYAILLLVSQHSRFALGGGGILLLILFLINYYVNQFRGSSLSINDLMAAGTAASVLKNYKLTMGLELWYSILYFLFFIALGFWCEIPGKGKKYHITVTIAALAYVLFFYCFWSRSDYLEDHGLQGHYWNVSVNEPLNGFLLNFGISMREMSMEKPEGYSEKTLLQIASETDGVYQVLEEDQTDNPNIILIMNEAWSDLRVLGNLETSEDFMPFVDSMSENTIKGNTYVEILGGLTANTEFEVLTGDSLAFLAPSAIPYQLQVNHEMYSLARVLQEQGYHTMAMHPSGGNAWNRDNVYRNLGFEEFIDITGFETEYHYVGNFISDKCNFDEIIWRYEHKEENVPLFLFDVTIQNHADYYGNTEILLNVEKIGNTAAEEAGFIYDVETYLNLMRVTDAAFEELIAYFQGVDEPVIICMFGDHQPNLNNDFYHAIFQDSGLTEEEQQALKYITPYVIWANYDVDFAEYGDMSANYLGAAVMECAGVNLPPYYKFILQMQKQYPELSHRSIDGLREEEMVKRYQILQYNHLMERNYEKTLFSVQNAQ
ncbi:MAG: LTA synthase family protein [Blautia sp.]|nr:LTA synthase family protein [Blautia sp.]